MCVQCAAGAMATMGAATGLRAWLGARAPGWFTPWMARCATGALVVGGIISAGVIA
jgi:hypothetical protein